MTDQDAMDQAQAQYDTLNEAFLPTLNECKTQEQRSQLSSALNTAHSTFVHTQRLFFENNSLAVQTIGQAAQHTLASIKASLHNLQNISQSLDAITAAVNVVAQVANVFI